MKFHASDKKTSPKSRRKLCLLNGVSTVLLIAMILPSQGYALDAEALPSGGSIAGGSATLDYAVPNELHVHQSSDRAVIDWDSFNIGRDAFAQFHQPSSSSLTVNRVTGDGDPTQILGRLSANGKIMVLDRNGIFFGPGSQVDAGSIIVSTGNVTNDNAMSGENIYIDGIQENDIIANYGTITAADAGLAAFVAPTVANNGIISARLGRIDMAAGSKATIDLYGDGLIELELSQTAQQTIANSGILSADGGSIYLQAAAAKDVVDNVISNIGIIAADSIGRDEKGRITLYAQGSNKTDAQGGSITINTGYISAIGNDDGEAGGSIDILGDAVLIGSNSLIDTSGDAGGGNIRIGGDYLGSGDTPASVYTYVGKNSVILNDALTSGDGGRTIIWSDDTTDFYGSIYGRGGSAGGNGGFVETSGKNNLIAQGYVDLTAQDGSKGTYLLDPADITIYGNFDPAAQTGAVAWYDAADESTITKTGTSISGWMDKVGGDQNLASNGSQAQWISNGLNSKGVVRFDGLGTLISAFPDFNDNISVYWVGSISSNTSDGLFEFGNGVTYNSGYNLIDWGTTMYWRTLASGNRDITQNFTIPGSYIYTGWHDGVNAQLFRNDALSGSTAAPALTNTLNTLTVGGLTSADYRSPNDFGELIVYNDDHSPQTRQLINQYLSAKWNIALDPSVGAGAEASEAMNVATGYGAFTTRYLERLSNTADIVLQAANSITLDFQGDNLSLASDRSISLTTTSGDIRTASAGTITTSRTGTGGNITLNAGDDITFNHNFTFNAQNGAQIQMTAADALSAPGTLTIQNGDMNASAQIINGTYVGKDAIMNSNAGANTATVTFNNLDIRGNSAALLGGYIGTSGPVTQTMANLIKINGAAASANPAYKFAGYTIGYVAPPQTNNQTISLIPSLMVQQTQSAMIEEKNKDAAAKGEIAMDKASSQSKETPAKSSANCLVSITDVGCVIQ